MRPGKWLYVVGVMIIVTGFILMAGFLINSLLGLQDHLLQLTVPGKYDLTFSEPGKYIIFYEHQSVVDGRAYHTKNFNLEGLTVEIKNKKSGEKIKITAPFVNSTYSLGGRKGVATFAFKIKDPGKYIFSGNYKKGAGGPEVVLAISNNFPKILVKIIFSSIAIVFSFSLIGIAVLLFTFFKRKSSRDKIKEDAMIKEGIKKTFWQELFSFQGRIGRWQFISVVFLIFFVAFILGLLSSGFPEFFEASEFAEPTAIVILVVLIIFVWIIQVFNIIKRFHDLDMSGLWTFVLLVPLLNLLLWVVLLFFKGTDGTNRFGEDPLR